MVYNMVCNKIYKKFLCLVIIFLFILLPVILAQEEEPNISCDKPENWDSYCWAYADYGNLKDSDWDKYISQIPESRYKDVKWEFITDYSLVILSASGIDWNKVNQAHIQGPKVSEIPADKFNPKQVQPANLKYANEEQIYLHLGEFENLEYCNPDTLNKVFLQNYNADVKLTKKSKGVRFNPQTKEFEGDFPSYKPEDYPADEYSQYIEDGKVIFIKKIKGESVETTDLDNAIIISGAKRFFKNNGVMELEPNNDRETSIKGDLEGVIKISDDRVINFKSHGLMKISPKGDLIAENARVEITNPAVAEGKNIMQVFSDEGFSESNFGIRKKWYESLYPNEDYTGSSEQNLKALNRIKEEGGFLVERLEGKFEKIDEVVYLHPYDRQQSSYLNTLNGVDVKTVGYDVAVSKKDATVTGYENRVIFDETSVIMKGACSLIYDKYKVSSKEKDSSYSNVKGDITAKGKLTIENEDMIYKGLQDSSEFKYKLNEIDEFISINGKDEGNVAQFIRKVYVGDLMLEKGFLSDKKEVALDIIKKDGKIIINMDSGGLKEISEYFSNPTKNAVIMKNLALVLGNQQNPDSTFMMNAKAGMLYSTVDLKGELQQTMIVSPLLTQVYLGDKMNGQMMAKALLNSFTQFSPKGYTLGDSVTISGKDGEVKGKIVGLINNKIYIDTTGDGISDNEISNDNEIISSDVSSNVLEQRREMLKKKPEEASRLLNEYETTNRGKNQQKAGEAAIQNLQLSVAFNLPIKTTATDVVRLQTDDKSKWIELKTEIVDGKPKITGWKISGESEYKNMYSKDTIKQIDDSQLDDKSKEALKYLFRREAYYSAIDELSKANPGYRIEGRNIEVQKYDDWYTEFEKNYGKNVDLMQLASAQVGDIYLRERNFDGAIKYYQLAADKKPNSDLGKEAKKNVDKFTMIMAISQAQLFAEMDYYQKEGRWGESRTFSKEFLEKLENKDLYERLWAVVSATAPLNIIRPVSEEALTYKEQYEISQKSLTLYSDLISKGYDPIEAMNLINVVSAGKPKYKVGQKVTYSYSTSSKEMEGEIIDRKILGGRWYYTIKKQDGSTEDVAFNLDNGKSGVVSFTKKSPGGFGVGSAELRGEDIILTRYTVEGDIIKDDKKDWKTDDKLVTNFKLYYDKASKLGISVPPEEAEYLEKNPAIQATLQMIKMSNLKPEERDKKLLELASEYRSQNNYQAAALIARQLSQTSSDKKIRDDSWKLYVDITDPRDYFFDLSDEAGNIANIQNLLADFTNPVMWMVGGGMVKLGQSAIKLLPGGAKILSVSNTLLDIPSATLNKLTGELGMFSEGSVGYLFTRGATEFTLSLSGNINPAVDIIVNSLTGGKSSELTGVQKNSLESAFSKVKIKDDGIRFIDPLSKDAVKTYTIKDGEIDIGELSKFGDIEAEKGVIKIKDPATGKTKMVFVQEGVSTSSLGGNFISLEEVQKKVKNEIYEQNIEKAKLELNKVEETNKLKMKDLEDKFNNPDKYSEEHEKINFGLADEKYLNINKEVDSSKSVAGYDDVPPITSKDYWPYFNEKVTPETEAFVESFEKPLEKAKEELQSIFPGKQVDARLKDPAKVEEKIYRDIQEGVISGREEVIYQNDPYQIKMRDVAGTRVTFETLEEMEKAAEILNNKEWQVLSYKNYLEEPKNGYRSIHFIVLVENRPVEIQLRTPELTKWADWAHDSIYKGSYRDNPEAIKYMKDTGDWLYNKLKGKELPKPECPKILAIANLCFTI